MPLLDRLSSTWRLAILQAITIATSLALCLSFAARVLRGDLMANARDEVIDDICEHAAVYNDVGLHGVDVVFAAGHHAKDEATRIVLLDGRVIGEHLPGSPQPWVWPEDSKVSALPAESGRYTVELPSDSPHLLVGRIVLKDGAVLWHGRLDAVDAESISHIKTYLWLAGLGAAVIALIPVLWYARQVMRPVGQMIDSAKVLARGHSEERLGASSAVPELRQFAASFNTVLERNHELTRELQAANDHLAHELRTPLSRIRGNLESFARHSTEPAARDAAERAVDEIDRASELVQTILTVRAGDHDALKLHRETMSLRELLVSIIDLYQPSAEDRGLSLSLVNGVDVSLALDRQRLVQAIANLLDNALAYTPAGGSVAVRLELHGSVAVVTVKDSGPGLQQSELQSIWQRYVRGSVASAKTPGMGLGLSLVRAITTAHGGSCGAANHGGGGAEFWIELPLTVHS
jgi:signal transduction histidine kinase